jgi:hypothetical protein
MTWLWDDRSFATLIGSIRLGSSSDAATRGLTGGKIFAREASDDRFAL